MDLGSGFIGSGVEKFVCPSTLKIRTDMFAVSSNKGSTDINDNSNNINSNKTRRTEETATSEKTSAGNTKISMRRFTTVCSSSQFSQIWCRAIMCLLKMLHELT